MQITGKMIDGDAEIADKATNETMMLGPRAVVSGIKGHAAGQVTKQPKKKLTKEEGLQARKESYE